MSGIFWSMPTCYHYASWLPVWRSVDSFPVGLGLQPRPETVLVNVWLWQNADGWLLTFCYWLHAAVDWRCGRATTRQYCSLRVERDLLLTLFTRWSARRQCTTSWWTFTGRREQSSEKNSCEKSLARLSSQGRLVFGSRPSDHYFRSVCWFVC